MLCAAMMVAACASSEGTFVRESSLNAAPAIESSDLMDADVGSLERLLGPPALTRREGEGEYRRYSLANCALIAILYPDELGELRVRYLDAAASRAGAPSPSLSACLAGD